MRLATVGVSSLDAALKLFRGIMKLKVERAGPLSRGLAKAWKLKPGTRARMAVLSCKGYPIGKLRLVEYHPVPKQKVRIDFGPRAPDSATDVGPKAIDFYVADPIGPSVRKIEAAGYKFRSPPVKHQIADTISEECLFSGPDGVPVLIMVGHRHSRNSLRPGSPDGPFSEIPTISICAGELERTRAFYGGVLGLTALTDTETPDAYRDLVDDLTGVPKGTRVHFLLYGKPPEASGKILVVHFYDRTGKRLKGRMKPGHLGFSLLTHDTADIDKLHRDLKSFGAKIVTPPTPIADDGAPYRTMLVQGPNEEMFEFTQALPAARTKAKPKTKAKSKAKKKAKKKAKRKT
ncbi:MAG: VOC family protein [Rhodospirillaceae bacterium]|nr:VOC family protein [Rhodospirillaceae bacterium]